MIVFDFGATGTRKRHSLNHNEASRNYLSMFSPIAAGTETDAYNARQATPGAKSIHAIYC